MSDYKLGTAGAAVVGVKVVFLGENILFVSVQVWLLQTKRLMMHIHVVFTVALSVAPVDKYKWRLSLPRCRQNLRSWEREMRPFLELDREAAALNVSRRLRSRTRRFTGNALT